MFKVELAASEIDEIVKYLEQKWIGYTPNVPDSWLEQDIILYNKLTNKNIDIKYIRENYINE